MKPIIYIHTNAQQLLGAKVSAYSLQRGSSQTDKFDIQIIELENFPHLMKRDGQPFLRGGESIVWRYNELQSFTLLRFLPPQLMNYEGRSAVIDPDIFAVGDVYELLARDMEGKAIMCRPSKRGKTFATSFMLLNNAKLRHWNWEEQVDELFAHKRDYQEWNQLLLENPETIGLFENYWNDFDHLDAQTKAVHNTERTTQPWKTGLDYHDLHRMAAHDKNGNSLKNKLRALVGKQRTEKHLQHPDRKQQDLFFGLLRECLEKNLVTEELLRAEIERKYLRPDALRVLDATPPLDQTLDAISKTPATA